MRPEQDMAERNNIIARAAELIRDGSAGTPQERATRAAELLRSLQYAADDPSRIGQGNCGVPAPHAAAAPGLAVQHTFTGSTAFMFEREEWKERALAAESKLSAADEAWHEQEDELQALRGKLDTARLALRDIMSRSNPQEWVFQRAHEALKDVGFPK